jgi:hypothetical protein
MPPTPPSGVEAVHLQTHHLDSTSARFVGWRLRSYKFGIPDDMSWVKVEKSQLTSDYPDISRPAQKKTADSKLSQAKIGQQSPRKKRGREKLIGCLAS